MGEANATATTGLRAARGWIIPLAMMKKRKIFALSAALVIGNVGVPAMAQADDYPPEARRLGLEGRVVFRATIGVDGRAKNCEIVQSSGHDILDDATCIKVIDTARFDPARDANGRPVEATFQNAFVWELTARNR